MSNAVRHRRGGTTDTAPALTWQRCEFPLVLIKHSWDWQASTSSPGIGKACFGSQLLEVTSHWYPLYLTLPPPCLRHSKTRSQLLLLEHIRVPRRATHLESSPA